MNIPRQILSIVLGLTLLSPALTMAQTSFNRIAFTNSPQADWHLVTTDDSGNQWYLDIRSLETNYLIDHNHYVGPVKVISPDGKPTEISLGIDCQDGAILNGAVLELSVPGLLQNLKHQSTLAQAMANAMCNR